MRQYDFDKLKNKNIDVSREEIKKVEDEVFKLKSAGQRRLAEVDTISESKQKFVDSECDLSPDSLLKNCEYSWDIVQSEDQHEIRLKFDFKNKAKVSLGEEPDYVMVKFWGAPYILTEDGDPIFKEPFSVRVRIPLLTDPDDSLTVTA
jgi:hypothetical protein